MNNDLLACSFSVERLLNLIKTDKDKFFKTHIKARTEFFTETVLAEEGASIKRARTEEEIYRLQSSTISCFIASREAVPEGEESEVDFEDGPESSEPDDDVMFGIEIPEEEDTSAAASAVEPATVVSTAGIEISEAIDFQSTPSTEPPVLHAMTVLALKAYVKERVIVIPAGQKFPKEQFPHLDSSKKEKAVNIIYTELATHMVSKSVNDHCLIKIAFRFTSVEGLGDDYITDAQICDMSGSFKFFASISYSTSDPCLDL